MSLSRRALSGQLSLRHPVGLQLAFVSDTDVNNTQTARHPPRPEPSLLLLSVLLLSVTDPISAQRLMLLSPAKIIGRKRLMLLSDGRRPREPVRLKFQGQVE
jgi:hypothetical protein